MLKAGLLSAEPGEEDGRQTLISLSKHGRELLPKLQACWSATALAASSLEADLPFPLSHLLDSAIRALGAKPFEMRIREARSELTESGAESPLPAEPRQHRVGRDSPPKSSRPKTSVRRKLVK
jgi:DNA-binding MarR family transcriptional regulator